MRTDIAAFAGLLCAASLAHAQQVLLEVDTGANRVLLLSPSTGAVLNSAFITDANSALTYDFQTPRAAIQVNSEIWVSDQSLNINAIYRFNLGGGYVGRIGGNVAGGGLSNVRGLRFIDGLVYAVNAGTANGATGPCIVKIDTAGNIVGSFSTVAVGGTVGNSPWDVALYNGRFLVSDGTSRGLQQYNADGSYFGAFTSAPINNIPAQIFVRDNGNVLMAANGSTPTNSYGLYELTPNGSVLRSWTGRPRPGRARCLRLGHLAALEHPLQCHRRHHLRSAEARQPRSRVLNRFLVQALAAVDFAVRSFAFNRQQPAIVQSHDDIGVVGAQVRLCQETALCWRVSDQLLHAARWSSGGSLPAHADEQPFDSAFHSCLFVAAPERLHPL